MEKELAAVKSQARDTASELTLAISDAACLQEELDTALKAADAMRMSNHQVAAALRKEDAVKVDREGGEERERLRKELEVGSRS